MSDGVDTEPLVEDIKYKLNAGAELDAEDIKSILAYFPSAWDYGELDQYRDDIDEAITGELGHTVFVSVLQDFESAGVLEELRQDLIDPSLDPQGFERHELDDRTFYQSIRVGQEATESVGTIHPPEKLPSDLWRIRKSVRDYLFATGMGFHLDAEMIYDYEADYFAFLQAVIDLTDGMDAYELTVERGENGKYTPIHVSLRSDNQSYHEEFEQVSDWLRFDALDPVQKALERETSQTIHYRGGNDGWILVLNSEHRDLVDTYFKFSPT